MGTRISGSIRVAAVVGGRSASQETTDGCNWPGKASVDPDGTDGPVFVASPDAEGLRLPVEVEGCGGGIHHVTSLNFKRCRCVVIQHVERRSGIWEQQGRADKAVLPSPSWWIRRGCLVSISKS